MFVDLPAGCGHHFSIPAGGFGEEGHVRCSCAPYRSPSSPLRPGNQGFSPQATDQREGCAVWPTLGVSAVKPNGQAECPNDTAGWPEEGWPAEGYAGRPRGPPARYLAPRGSVTRVILLR